MRSIEHRSININTNVTPHISVMMTTVYKDSISDVIQSKSFEKCEFLYICYIFKVMIEKRFYMQGNHSKRIFISDR